MLISPYMPPMPAIARNSGALPPHIEAVADGANATRHAIAAKVGDAMREIMVAARSQNGRTIMSSLALMQAPVGANATS